MGFFAALEPWKPVQDSIGRVGGAKWEQRDMREKLLFSREMQIELQERGREGGGDLSCK